jgi:L-ascorbate metabolism protein UlaG (beta-lactamase superfamily)
VKITYFGHAFFLLESDDGPAIALDPFDDSVGYRVPKVRADIVLASHEHFDHGNVAAVQGKPQALVGRKGVGDHTIAGVPIRGVATRHYDDPAGAARGENTMFVFELDGVRLCHVGDLGHPLDAKTAGQLGRVDLLMLPIGGFYTLDVGKVDSVVDRLTPRVVIPMHYRTPASRLDKIATKDTWLKGKVGVVEKPSTAQVDAGTLPATPEIWVMAYAE